MILKTKKAKLIAILIAAVSLVLSVVIVLLSVSSCNSDPTVVKTVKKVIKKKVIVVEEPEIDSEESNTDSENDDFYSDFGDDDQKTDVIIDSDNNSDNNSNNDNSSDNSDSFDNNELTGNNTSTDESDDSDSNNSTTDDNDNSDSNNSTTDDSDDSDSDNSTTDDTDDSDSDNSSTDDKDDSDSNNSSKDDNDVNSDNSSTDDNNDSNNNNSNPNDNNDSDNSTNTDEDPEPQYEVELYGEIKTRLSDKIAFGFWNYTWGDWENLHGDKFGKETEIITHGNVGDIESAKWCKENGVSGWLMCGPTEGSFEPDSAVLKESWKKTVLDTAEMYKYAGVWDVVEGYHFDEPLGKISGEQFRVVTKFLAESFPDKRIYPVFSSMEVNGTHGCDAINYENCGYITDLGYDAYDSLDINFYREKFAQIQKQIGRKDVRLWVFPVSYQKTSAFDENHMLTHLNILYEVLKEFENPGGIHMYSFKPYGSTPAFQQLTDPELQYKYDKFLNRVVEVAKEVNQMEYTYKITKN